MMAKMSGLVPLVGVTSGRCFAGNAALLGCCDVIIATRNSTIGMGGPAMIEGGGLGVGLVVDEFGCAFEGLARGRGLPLQRRVANGAIQVGPEGLERSASALDRTQNLQVGLGDEIVGVGDRRELLSCSATGAGMALPEHTERTRVTRSCEFGELLVAETTHVFRHGCSSTGPRC